MPTTDPNSTEGGHERKRATSLGVVGFHLTPPVWVGDELPKESAEVTLAQLQTEVYRRCLAVGICVRVLHSGVFIFDFSKWPEDRVFFTQPKTWNEYDQANDVTAKRVQIMNAYLACLYSAAQEIQGEHHEKMVVAPPDLAIYTSFEAPPSGIDDFFVLGLTRTTRAGTFKAKISSTFKHRFQRNITGAALVRSFELLEELLSKTSPDALLYPDILLRSRKAYEDLDYGLCLILAWTMTEKMLFSLWDKHIAANRSKTIDGQVVTFINKDRVERLTNSQNFTASTVAEVLSLLDVLPFDIYRRTVEVRSRRNKWMHELQPVARTEAEVAVRLAADMLKFVEEIDLPASLRVNISLG